MISKINRSLKKLKNYEFRKKQKKMREKIFVPHVQNEKFFRKRKKINVKIPSLLQLEYIKKNLKYYYISLIILIIISFLVLLF
jgi:hypothetical protein